MGINPHPKNKGHYFNSNRAFWKLLHEAGLTDEIIDDTRLLSYNYGIVNLVDRPTVSAKELKSEELLIGAYAVKYLIEQFNPKAVVALGNLVYNLLKSAGVKNLKFAYFPTSRVANYKKIEALRKVIE